MFQVRKSIAAIRELDHERLWLLGVVTAGHSVIHWYQQLFPVILPTVKMGLGLSDVQVGALAAARQLVFGTLTLPSGMLADSLARHRSLILASSLISMGLGYLLFGTVHVFYWSLLAAGLVGLGIALWHPAAMGSVSNRFPERRATALAIHEMGATLSDIFTPVAAGALLVTYPWRNVMGFQIVPALVVALLIWLALRGVLMGAVQTRHQSSQVREIGQLARNPKFIGLAAANGLLQMGQLVFLTFLPIYLQEHLGYTPFGLGFFLTLLGLGLGGIVSLPALGFLSDRLGRRAVLLPSFLILGSLYVLLLVAAPGIQLGVVITAIGIFPVTLTNITAAGVMDVAGARIQASSFGLLSLVTLIIVLPTPVLAGFLVGLYGIESVFVMSATFTFIAALVVTPLKL